MAISFACRGCGKRYDVDEAMAGRRARCKQCSAEFRVPDSLAPIAARADPRGDVFGLDDPTPGGLPPRARGFDDDVSAPKRIKPKKARAQKSTSGGGAPAIVIVGLIALLGLGGIGFVAIQGGLPTSPESDFERNIKDEIAAGNEFLALLATVHDVSSAQAASASFAAMMPRFETIKQKYLTLPKPTGWEDSRLGIKYNTQLLLLKDRMTAEIERVQGIPGAADALRSRLPGLGGFPAPPRNPGFEPPHPPGPPPFQPPGMRPPGGGRPPMPGGPGARRPIGPR